MDENFTFISLWDFLFILPRHLKEALTGHGGETYRFTESSLPV